MEKENYSQLELFSSDSSPSPQPSKSFLRYLRNYEKVVLVAIGCVVISVVAYSLGVKKGKRITAFKSAPVAVDMALLKPKAVVPAVANREIYTTSQPIKIEVKDQAPVTPRGNLAQVAQPKKYTIQVASYESKTKAQVEINKLKKKGFTPVLIPKGKYNLVCLGNFTSKKTAELMLSQLRKHYRDCIIRRL